MTGRTRFEKLVRDLIPAIIRKDGRIPVIRQLDDQAIRPFVAQKLLEEAHVEEALGEQDVWVIEPASRTSQASE